MDGFESGNYKGRGLRTFLKVLTYVIILALVFAGGGVAYKFIFDGGFKNSLSQGTSAPVASEVTTAPVQETPVATIFSTPRPVPIPTASQSPKSKLSQRQRILDEMHKMANSKVVADLIWGEKPITEEEVSKLIAEVSQTNFADRDKLLTILENWKTGDYSNAVKDHNYIWEQLGGTIGKATALREEN